MGFCKIQKQAKVAMFSMDLLNTKIESHWMFLKQTYFYLLTYLAALGLGCGMWDRKLWFVELL